MRVPKLLLPILVIAALLGSVVVAQATGNWETSGKQMLESGSLSQPADIRGWMTLQNLSDAFGIPQEALYTLLDVPAEIPPETALKDLEAQIGFEVSTAREILTAYLAGGALPSGEAPTPTPAPTAAPTPTPTPTPAATAEHAPLGAGPGAGKPEATPEDHVEGSGPLPPAAGVVLAPADIKGRYTVQQIADSGQVLLAKLLQELGLPPNFDPNTAVKDLPGQGTVTEVQDVRDALERLQHP